MNPKDELFKKAKETLVGAPPEIDAQFPDNIRTEKFPQGIVAPLPTDTGIYYEGVNLTSEVHKNAPVAPVQPSFPTKPVDTLSESQFVVWTELEKNGFVWNLTLRKGISASEIDNVLSLIDTAQLKAISKGFKYHEKKSNFPAKKSLEFIEGKVCPKCGEKLVKGVGKVAEKCSTNKYDFTTKTSSGCDYVLWV